MLEEKQPLNQEPPVEAPQEAAGETARRATRADTPAPSVKLEAYEGPLDLLLDLIRKQKINIYDIPIATITRQYLDYLRLMEELNIDVAGEFILVAATLIYIKSRMLLPPDPTAPAEEQEEDPRAELVQRLLDHEQFRNAAEMLKSKRTVEEATWSHPGIDEFTEAEDEPGLAVSVFDLISVFRDILERAKKRPQIQVRREQITVREMLEHVKQVMRARPGPVSIEELVAGYVWRQALIALLLALLELVRLRAIQIRQEGLFAPISAIKSKQFEEIVNSVDATDLEESLGEIQN